MASPKKELPVKVIGDILGKPDFSGKFAVDFFENFSVDDTMAPHRHDFFELVWFQKGDGIHAVDFREHIIKPGAIFCMSPGQTHNFSVLKNASGVNFMFQADFIPSESASLSDSALFTMDENDAVFPDKKDAAFLNQFLSYLNEEQKKNDEHTQRSVLNGLQYYISFLERIQKEQNPGLSPSENRRLIQRLKNYIYDNLTRSISLRECAAELDIPVLRLQTILKENLDTSLKQLVLEIQIIEAQRRLLYGNESVRVIAESVGVQDQSYFTRYFKKKTGLSPTEFRTRHKKS